MRIWIWVLTEDGSALEPSHQRHQALSPVLTGLLEVFCVSGTVEPLIKSESHPVRSRFYGTPVPVPWGVRKGEIEDFSDRRVEVEVSWRVRSFPCIYSAQVCLPGRYEDILKIYS